MLRPVLFAAALLFSLPAAAQAPLSCTPQNVGQQVCQAEGVCRCVYFAGGTMFREPAGYKWDCNILFGRCSMPGAFPILSQSVVPGGPVLSGTGRAMSQRDRIKAAQAELQKLGYQPGSADGVLGSRTKAALRAFQKASQLPQTGSLTPATLNRLGVG